MSDEKVMEKVRRLLAQAEDQAGTPEGEAFSAKAESLMLKHSIDQAMLAERGIGADEIGSRELFIPAPYTKQKFNLLGSVARLHQARALLHGGHYSKGGTVTLYGYTGDIERIEALFTSLCLQAFRGLKLAQPPLFEDTGAFRRSWMVGFSVAVVQRMKEQRDQAQSEADRENANGRRAELVLCDRAAKVDAHVDEMFPHAKPLKTQTRGSGVREGYQSGLAADLGNRRVTSRRRQLESR